MLPKHVALWQKSVVGADCSSVAPRSANRWRCRWLARWIALWAGLWLAGCGRSSEQRFAPSPDIARAALEAVLNDWQAGKLPGPIAGQPVIQVADTQRRGGQVLLNYEILGELPADEDRRFQVRLALDQPAAEEKAQYVVVGIDPLWVFRQEDYDMGTQLD